MKKVCAEKDVLPPPLLTTDFPWLGEKYQGKVRDSYTRNDTRILIATDRLSAFDRPITSVPGKGQVLTQMAKYWFEQSAHIAPNHMVAVPDPSVMVVHEVSIIPIEVVVRGFLVGSAWRDYKEGRSTSGVTLPKGLREFEQLSAPIITPCTKEPVGFHDLPISEWEIVSRKLVSQSQWDQIRSIALALFEFATKRVMAQGLLLADTKYEFGLRGNSIVLADEIHTLDCSRFWSLESYERRLRAGDAPEMLDKEPVRRWLMERGFSGEGAIPVVPDEYRSELREYYRTSAERVIGLPLQFDDADPLPRIERNLRRFFSDRVV